MREEFIELINFNGGYNGKQLSHTCTYSITELQSILEFGDPRAFVEQEYSFEHTHDNNNEKLLSHYLIPDENLKIQEDLRIAKKLNIYKSIVKSVDYDTKKSKQKLDLIIENLLHFPHEYHQTIKFILDFDLKTLLAFCMDYRAPDIKKILCVWVLKRSRLHGNYTSLKKVCKAVNEEYTGFMKLRGAVDKVIPRDEDVIKESMRLSAYEILFELRRFDLITPKDLKITVEHIKNLNKEHPEVFRGIEEMHLVIAMVGLVKTGIHLHKLLLAYEEKKKIQRRRIYQAAKRALIRCEIKQ
ncbi:MAG: hypothetical protein INQ03_09235 [Candidatus Heimdallarchaeota archaeon]|nr:hypothetical protein [Candidatus Heimdallarchaeota archaeon]